MEWLFPGIGTLLVDEASQTVDRELMKGLRGALDAVKEPLLFRPDRNLLRGLSALVPPDRSVTLPDGRVVPIGSIVRDRAPEIIERSRLVIEVGPGFVMPDSGFSGPGMQEIRAPVLYLGVQSPLLSFDASLVDRGVVRLAPGVRHVRGTGHVQLTDPARA